MKKFTIHSIRYIAAAALAGVIVTTVALASTENIGAVVATSSNPCAGKYTAYAKMTNADNGTIWIVPPTNTVVTNGLFSDLSTVPQPYASYATVSTYGTPSVICNSNHVSFPATNGGKYQLMVVITNSPSPVTNGQQLTLDVQWNVP